MPSGFTGVVLAGLLLIVSCSSPPVARARNDVPEPAVSPPLAEAPAGSQVTLPAGTAPEGLVADPTTGVLAAGVRNPDGVMLLDLTRRKIRARIVLSGAPRHLRLEHPGGPVLVPAEGADRLYLLSLPTGEVTGSFTTGSQPHDVAAAAGAYFVGDELANTVHLIRPGTSTTILPGPLQPGGVAASANGSTVMVVGVRGRRLQEINSNGTVIGSAECGVGPTHIRSGRGNLFYIADTQGNRVLVFRAGPKRPTPLGSVYTGGTPYGLAIDQRRDMLYVTLTGTNKLRSFWIESDHLEARRTWPTVRQPNDVTVDDATGTVIIAGAANNVLEFIAP